MNDASNNSKANDAMVNEESSSDDRETEAFRSAFRNWIRSGRGLTSKALARRFPGVVVSLREGVIEPESAIDLIEDAFPEPFLPMTDIDNDFHTYTCQELTKLAIPAAWQNLVPPINQGILQEFVLELRKRWIQGSETCTKEDFPDELTQVSCWLQEAFDVTCRMFGPRLDILYAAAGQPLPYFLQHCPLYRLPSQETFSEYVDKFRKMVNKEQMYQYRAHKLLRKSQLEHAVLGVTEGLHEIKNTCWECEMLCQEEEDLQQCSQCHVACYCGRDCQVQAWKTGHKHKCQELQKRFALFEQTFKTVKAAHKVGTLQSTQLNDDFDYNMAKRIVLYDKNIFPDLDGPSMETFYANLDSVIQGNWWFYNDADSMEEYNKKLENYSTQQFEDESMCCTHLAFYMCFDHFKKPALQGRRRRRPAAIKFDSSSQVMLLREACGYSLPRARFMEMYISSRKCYDQNDTATLRWNQKVGILKELRKIYHK